MRQLEKSENYVQKIYNKHVLGVIFSELTGKC